MPEIMENKLSVKLDLSDIKSTAVVCNALSSEVRLEILKLLVQRAASIGELAERFQLPMSSMCMHVKKLKDAGLITVSPRPGVRGNRKLCGLRVSSVGLDLFAHLTAQRSKAPSFVEMPIGNYTNCEIAAPCGLASASSYIYEEDSPYGFYEPNHTEASLLWFTHGYLEYSFPNNTLQIDKVSSVEFSFELCSEAPGYREDWPSDISFELNHKQIAVLHVKGDYGERKGTYNPDWWSSGLTQHGELIRIRINHEGSYINSSKISDETIESLKLLKGYHFSMTLRVDPKAEHVGGMNLFGKHFGDYSQDIVMRVEYE